MTNMFSQISERLLSFIFEIRRHLLKIFSTIAIVLKRVENRRREKNEMEMTDCNHLFI